MNNPIDSITIDCYAVNDDIAEQIVVSSNHPIEVEYNLFEEIAVYLEFQGVKEPNQFVCLTPNQAKVLVFAINLILDNQEV